MKTILKKALVITLILCELFQATGVYALTKEENVYVKLNENGKEESVTISEHLYDYSGKNIKDKSSLTNIKNINGDEKYNQNGSDLVWETNGKEIYYQGQTDKELPISIDVKYYLDGKQTNVDDMLGKKGNIKIVLKYTNKLSKKVNINGKQEKIYVPYAIVTTSILNNTNNKNIKVTNGKIINNGESSVITAISSPGLYESLKLEKLKDLDTIEINYDTDYFELSSIYSIATTSLFDDSNMNMFKDINDIYKNIDLLQSNMNTIVDASKKLSDGSNQMDSGINELNNKIQELTKKYKYYRSLDKNTLKEKIITIIEDNLKNITPALEEEITKETSKILHDNQEELENAVIIYTKENTKKVLEPEINKIISKLNLEELITKVVNSNTYNLLKDDKELKEITNLLKQDINKELVSTINNKINELTKSIDVKMPEEEQTKYIESLAQKYGVTYEQAKGIAGEVQSDTLNQVKKNINSTNISEQIISSLNNKEYMSNIIKTYIEKLNSKITSTINSDSNIKEYTKELKEKIITAINKDLQNNNIYENIDVKEYLNKVVDKIIDNTASDLSKEYTGKYANEVVENVIKNQLSDKEVDSKLREVLDIYEDDIDKKVTKLDDTINLLSDSLNQLKDGSTKISTGMNTLYKGLNKYNKEGINKINKLVNSDLKTLQQRLEALKNLSKENNTIDDIPSKANSTSKMIFMIDSKSKPVEKIENSKEEKKKSIFDKIIGLFN